MARSSSRIPTMAGDRTGAEESWVGEKSCAWGRVRQGRVSHVIGGGHTDSEGEQSREDLYRMTRQTDEPNFVAPKFVHTLFFLVVGEYDFK